MPETLSTAERRRRWREAALPSLRGVVLDLGAGSGVAADHLAPEVEWLALEPRRRTDPALSERLGRRTTARLLIAPAELIPLESEAVDAVIASTVLCSVRKPARALAEIRRVLRPGGKLVFFEHVAADRRTWTSALQAVYSPLSRLIDHGCDPHRRTGELITAAGFADVVMQRSEAPGVLGTVEPLIDGTAIR
ncbi:Ubiquinone/menaquinone biosynthesis C-methyltransferase UbiE [Microbacterium hydrocarbonoxydans]|uniref:Ubiquinone/menaquinone biosynthesis C-methyltransferase UbiE n=1 Tax=Microbacterium hydrocarbonoxydans TaxID=273678 RepID=A0A0M2HRS5_9MICO|nr:class I SAM-dependent methyltransferase [Microbacterium hydrocarbonoxydans]KJL47630.1 Ubiquinone/menaquinone biosynthesis C-methyltransferase UbiE [Microbacterium hydrocarbonoxydans]